MYGITYPVRPIRAAIYAGWRYAVPRLCPLFVKTTVCASQGKCQRGYRPGALGPPYRVWVMRLQSQNTTDFQNAPIAVYREELSNSLYKHIEIPIPQVHPEKNNTEVFENALYRASIRVAVFGQVERQSLGLISGARRALLLLASDRMELGASPENRAPTRYW